MLAMGLGITPYRALLKSLELKNGDGGTVALQAPIELLYYNRTGTFLYEDELNTLCEKTQTTKELLTDFAKFQSEIKAFVNHHEDDGRYFVVGSPKMTKELVAFLRGLGINKKHILKDSFIGH
jgi:ferredoxin-NADP reductase